MLHQVAQAAHRLTWRPLVLRLLLSRRWQRFPPCLLLRLSRLTLRQIVRLRLLHLTHLCRLRMLRQSQPLRFARLLLRFLLQMCRLASLRRL